MNIFLGLLATAHSLPEMEDLLHLAIRNSNLSKLSEMAQNGYKLNVSETFIDQVMETYQETQNVFRDTVSRSLLSQDLEAEDEYIACFDFIEDYGNHLVDTGDLLHKMNSLEPLLNTVLKQPDFDAFFTPLVIEKAADLLVSITQNREPTQLLVRNLKPSFLYQIFHNLQNVWHCFDSAEFDNLCSALVGVLNAMLNDSSDRNQVFLTDLAKTLTRLQPTSNIFSRLLNTFRILNLNKSSPVDAADWMSALDSASLLSLSNSAPLKVAERILRLLDSLSPTNKIQDEFLSLYYRCVNEKGAHDNWCRSLAPQLVLDHSSEL